jgi:hypothetical protein
VAAEAQQPRQPAQGVQRYLHGGNEDDEPWPETVVLCPGGGVTWKESSD